MKQLEKDYGDALRVEYHHHPLSFHDTAAMASMAAHKQGKFFEMVDKLYANMKKQDTASLEGYAKAIGIDVEQFKKDVEDPAFQKQIDEDQKLAAKVGARGTPNFLINGQQLSGAQPFEKFDTVIGEQIAAAEAELKKGTKKDALYAAMVKANFKAPAARPDAKGAQGPDTSTVYKIPVGENSYATGGDEPLVTILEFSEFQCPFCARVLPTMDKIKKEYGDKVRIVFKHNPLPFHKDAPLASKAALAAGEQGKFWEMHDLLFKNQKALKEDQLKGYATEIGLDAAKFAADLQNPKLDKIIAEDQKVAAQFGARGTPNFFINGRQLTGARPFDSFKEVIDAELKKAEALMKKGIARKSLYEELTKNGATKAAAPTARKPSPRADDNTVYKVPVSPGDATDGPADALVTIVEFSEFQCPFCARVLPTTKQIKETYGKDVRIVFKHNPLPFHKEAPYASEAALAAGQQGKFWEMHDKLFANQRALQADKIEGYATEIGLDLSKFKADLASSKFKEQIKRDQALASSIGAGGTPNFFINGKKLVGAQPFDNFKKVIDAELATAKAMEKKGVARAKIYEETIKNGATKPAAPARAAAEPDNKVYDVKVNPNDYIKGNKNAKITIVEFSEYQCPFCSRVEPTMKQVLDTYGDKVRVVFKHNPLSFHKDAPGASAAALAAGSQGKFWEMHDILFENQRALQRDKLEGYAQEIGLNMEKFKADLDGDKFKAQIDADIAQARSLGASGTPTFFINGKKLRGAQPFASFKQIIDEELKK